MLSLLLGILQPTSMPLFNFGFVFQLRWSQTAIWAVLTFSGLIQTFATDNKRLWSCVSIWFLPQTAIWAVVKNTFVIFGSFTTNFNAVIQFGFHLSIEIISNCNLSSVNLFSLLLRNLQHISKDFKSVVHFGSCVKL